MVSLLQNAILLGDRNVLRSFGTGLRGEQGHSPASNLLLLAAVVLGICIAVTLVARWRARGESAQRFNSPRALFRALCKAHGLNRHSRRLLDRLAGHYQLAHPALVFVEPQRFHVEALPPSWGTEQARLAELKAMLFSTSANRPPVEVSAPQLEVAAS